MPKPHPALTMLLAPLLWAGVVSADTPTTQPAARTPTTQPASSATTQPADDTPAKARRILELIRRLGQMPLPEPNDYQAQTSYTIRVTEATEALETLRKEFPAVSARPEVRQAALNLLFDQAYVFGDNEMKALRKLIDEVLTDAVAPRDLRALAHYYRLQADLRSRWAAHATTQPDEGGLPPWIDQELARWIAFAKEFKETPSSQRAFRETVVFQASRLGVEKARPFIDDYVATYPTDKQAQADLLVQVAFQEYSLHRDGWERAKPIVDRLLADYHDQPVTVKVLAELAGRRVLSDPEQGMQMLQMLTEEFPGSEPVANVWGQLALHAHRQNRDADRDKHLAVLGKSFPKTRSRESALGEIAFSEYARKGLDSAQALTAKLRKELPEAEIWQLVQAQMAIAHMGQVGYEKARPFVEAVLKEFGETEIMARLRGVAHRYATVGKQVELKFTSLEGPQVDVSKMRGQVVVVCFWASWSKSCTAITEGLIGLGEQLKERGLKLVGVALDEDRDELLAYRNQKKVTWLNAFDEKGAGGPLPMQWGVTDDQLPFFLVIGREGKLLDPGTADLRRFNQLLSAQFPQGDGE